MWRYTAGPGLGNYLMLDVFTRQIRRGRRQKGQAIHPS